jgi:hypothetical protein
MKTLLLTALLLIPGELTGCSAFEIHEAICSKGEEPTWAVTNTTGAICVPDGESPQDGFARYPRGRVPVWINPPSRYAHRTDDGHDLYNVNPNDPNYPWWDEVVAEHPEFTCDDASSPLAELPMEPHRRLAPKVTVVLNSVGNSCYRFDRNKNPGTVVRWDLTVRENDTGSVWEQSGQGSSAAREFLRVASDSCMALTASLQVAEPHGKLTTYRLNRSPVRPTCEDG